jgi:DNA-binding beta-propeller fold protein YncE/photosystem II stability/assembly factor-like uncharacterized protein
MLDFRVPAGNSYNPGALAFSAPLNCLYARTKGLGWEAAGTVATLDPATGQVRRVVETGPDEFAAGDLAVDTGHNWLYVVNSGDHTASILDATTLDAVTVLNDVDQLSLDAEDGRLYVAGLASLRVLDTVAQSTLRQASLPAEAGAFDLAVDAKAGRIYLVVLDRDGYALIAYDADTLAQLNIMRLPSQPASLVADPGRGRAYVTASDTDQDLLLTLDSEGRLLEQRVLGESSGRTVLALDEAGGRLFLGRDVYPDYRVEVVNVENGRQVAEIGLEYSPNKLLWDGANSHLWVSHTYQNLVTDVDMDTGRVRASYPTAVGVTDLAVDPGRGYLFVADTSNRLHVLDSDTDMELAVLPGGDRIAVDSVHAHFYTGGWYAPLVRVFDADQLRQIGEIPLKGVPVADAHSGGLYVVNQGIHLTDLDTFSITGVISDTLPQSPGYSPNPTAVDAVVDPGTGRIFAIIGNGVPGSNGGSYLYVYEPVTFEKVLEDRERSPSYIDINPTNGWAYVSRSHLAGASTSLLVDGRNYTARIDSLFGGLRLDPELGGVFVTVPGEESGQIYVLDASTLEVLDSAPIPGDYSLWALDPLRHWLYLVQEDGLVQIWTATGGQHPAAAAPQPADLAAAGPYRLVLPPGEVPQYALDTGWRLYRSDDGGGSWGRAGGGLPAAMTNDLAVSPSFEQDHALWAGLGTSTQGYGVWKSTDAGDSWRLASHGLTDLAVTNLAISPAFDADHTLFASAHIGGLYRSTDGGETWLGLTHLYRPPDTYPGGPTQVLFSPTFGQDHTLFIEHYGFRRSEDGGDTWHALGDAGGGYFQRRLILAPDYASSHVVYCLSVALGQGSESYVLGSLDGGDTWSEVGPGPIPEEYAEPRVLVAPGGFVYLVGKPWDLSKPAWLYRSSSIVPVNGRPVPLQWEEYAGGPLEAATPLDLTSDGQAFVALDASGRLLRWSVKNLTWKPVASPTPMPLPTPTPTAGPCALEPDRFRAVWEPVRVALGCPVEQAQETALAEQSFEKGHMIWDSTTRQIYVLFEFGTWKVFEDTWQEGVDPAWDPSLPAPPKQPQRGFGKVWREQLEGPPSTIGWALEDERAVNGWRQQFGHGLLFWTDQTLDGAPSAGTAFLLFGDGTWEVTPAP